MASFMPTDPLVTVGNCIIAGVGLGAAVLVKDDLDVGVCEDIISAEGVWVKVGTPFGLGWT